MKRTRIAPRSPKRDAERELRDIVRTLAFARDRHACTGPDGGAPGRCGGELDPDERIPRSSWAQGYLAVDNVQTLCRAHHDWKHARNRDAVALGFRRSAGAARDRWLVTAEVPALGCITWALPTAEAAARAAVRLGAALAYHDDLTVTTTDTEEQPWPSTTTTPTSSA